MPMLLFSQSQPSFSIVIFQFPLVVFFSLLLLLSIMGHRQVGNWRRPPTFQNKNPPLAICRPAVPRWEKEFCTSVGSVPWRKLVETKKYMDLHEKVMNWDDSACKETFDSAKRRFWAAINGLPCDISLPDPNIYIDDIDWNSSFDPELILDLEREAEVPSDEGVVILDSTYLFDQSFFCIGWGDAEEDTPKQTDLFCGAQVNQYGYYIVGPWQQYCTPGEAAHQYGWQNYWNDSWGWNQRGHYDHDWRNMSWETPAYHHGDEYQMTRGTRNIRGNLACGPCVDNRANA